MKICKKKNKINKKKIEWNKNLHSGRPPSRALSSRSLSGLGKNIFAIFSWFKKNIFKCFPATNCILTWVDQLTKLRRCARLVSFRSKSLGPSNKPRDQLSVKFGQRCEIWSMSSAHLHVGHHIVHHVGHHVSHHNVISLCYGSETLTE